jgi:hypothetical protein
MAVRYFRTRVSMQWSLPASVSVVRNETVRRRWFGQNWFVLGAEQLLSVVDYGCFCERIKG